MYEIVLFLHLLTIGIAFLAIGMMLLAVLQLRNAETVSDALRAIAASASVEKVMPLATVLLLLTGGYLTQVRWTWTTPWVDVAIAGLLLITFIGAVGLGSRARALHAELEAARGNAIDATLSARVHDPFLMVGSGLNVGLVAGVMYVMVLKPALFPAIAALLIGGAVGAAVFGMLAQPKQRVTA